MRSPASAQGALLECDHEQATIREAPNLAARGLGLTIPVQEPAGIGKSMLLADDRRAAADGRGATPHPSARRNRSRATSLDRGQDRRRPPHARTPHRPDVLTASERHVTDLAGGGLTSPQIAQALFVTAKTVEYPSLARVPEAEAEHQPPAEIRDALAAAKRKLVDGHVV